VLEKNLLLKKAQYLSRKKPNIAVNCLIFFIATYILQFQTFAQQTNILPQNISNTSVIMGNLSGLDQKFTSNGSLVKLKDQKSIEFDAETISKFNPEAITLVQTLNRFGLYNAGDLFNLGTLEIDAHPVINYIAPTYAHGINSSWTIAFAIPIIKYVNTVEMKQSFSNKSYYEQFRGLSNDLDAALDTNLMDATQNTLKKKGYEPIENQNETFFGDLQFVSLYKFLVNPQSHFVHNLYINLPTGPEHNPDNLMALNTFHKFYFENILSYSYLLGSFVAISPFIGLKYFIPMNKTVRVPKDNNDTLPDQNSKENLIVQDGLSQEVGALISWNLNDNFSLTTMYKIGQRQIDNYSASSKGLSNLLEKNTNASWQKYSIELNYSLVKSFLNKKSLLPLSISFKTFDTLFGQNIEKQSGQELTLSIYF